MDIKIYSLPAKIENFERVNSQFAKVKIYVMYTGKNRNHTDISKQVVENALYSLKNIPVVGEWKEEKNNFGGHGGKLELSDEGIEWIETTKPYGVVPSDTEIRWEKVREKDGITENEYLTCTAYLWYRRYPELEKVLNDGANQSMEIQVNEYHEDDNGYFVFDEMEFSALCILGKDSNPENNVEPCFEGAKITNYSLDKDSFKLEFAEMVKELKHSLSSSEVDGAEGGSEVQDEKFENEEVLDENEDTTSEEFEEVVEDESLENVDNEDGEQSEEEFEENENSECADVEHYQKQIDELQMQYDTLKNDYDALEKEAIDLRKFQATKLAEERKQAEDTLFSQFDEQLAENEEYEQLKQKASEYELEQLEKEVAFILVKNGTSFKFTAKQPTKKDKVKIEFSKRQDDEAGEFDDLFQKYNINKEEN